MAFGDAMVSVARSFPLSVIRIVQVVRSILIKDATKEEREEIIRSSLDCGAGSCENCSSCWLGGGNPWEIYQDYIDGKREIREINMEYNERYLHGRQIKG